MTEVERYEKRTPEARATKKQNVTPQQAWMDLIVAAIDIAPTPQIQSYLRSMSTLDNVPRKEKAFYNFTSNSLNLRGPRGQATVAEIWMYLKSTREQQQSSTKSDPIATKQESGRNQTTGLSACNNAETDTSAEKDAAMISAVDLVVNDGKERAPFFSTASSKTPSTRKDGAVDKQTVKKAMKSFLKKAVNRSLSIKRLRRAVREKIGSIDQSRLKQLVKENLDEKQTRFVQDGQIVTLVIKKNKAAV